MPPSAIDKVATVALAIDTRQARSQRRAYRPYSSRPDRLLRAGDQRRDQIDRKQPGEPGKRRWQSSCHLPEFTEPNTWPDEQRLDVLRHGACVSRTASAFAA